MSAVTTFPKYFSLPGSAVTLNMKRLFCGMKISHLRLHWLLLTKEIFPVNHASCKKKIVLKLCLYAKRQIQLISDFSKIYQINISATNKIEVASLTTFYCLTMFKQFNSL